MKADWLAYTGHTIFGMEGATYVFINILCHHSTKKFLTFYLWNYIYVQDIDNEYPLNILQETLMFQHFVYFMKQLCP